MNIDGHEAVSLLCLILTAMGVLLFFFYRSTQSADKKRVDDLERAREKGDDARGVLAERVRLAELESARLQGTLAAALQRVDALERDQIPRGQLEAQFKAINDQLATIVSRLDKTSGRYSSSDPAFSPPRKA